MSSSSPQIEPLDVRWAMCAGASNPWIRFVLDPLNHPYRHALRKRFGLALEG